MVVHAAAGKHRQLLVLLTQVAKEVSYFYFALCTGQVVVASESYFFGHLCKERIQRRHTNLIKHQLDVFFRMRKKLVLHSVRIVWAYLLQNAS